MKQEILANLVKSLPPVFGRKEASRLLGGIISSRTLANLDSQGRGPKGRILLGRTVVYERDSFVAWIGDRMQDIDIEPGTGGTQ